METETGLLEFETRRNIKPGDIFRAHMEAATERGAEGDALAAALGKADIDQILAVRAFRSQQQQQQQQQGEGKEPSVRSESDLRLFLRGHEAFSARRGWPYHWGQRGWEAEHMDKLQIGVMDAIHDALSKEELIKKLIIPFNGTFENKYAVSHWEWQKNTAILELEKKNQELQHKLTDAAKQVLEAQSLAQHDRKLLEEALQKGKEELYLIRRAEAMRARLIEQKQVIARNQILSVALSLWNRFCQGCKKKRILKKSQLMWRRCMMIKWFNEFVNGYKRIKYNRHLKVQAKCHWTRKTLGGCFRVWFIHSHGSKEEKQKVAEFVRTWTAFRQRAAYKGWLQCSSIIGWKKTQQKRAKTVFSFTLLRKVWHGWCQHVVFAKEKKLSAEGFFFQRLGGDCFSKWWTFVWRKIQDAKKSAQCVKLRELRLHQIAFYAWMEKIRLSFVVRERLLHFVRRCGIRLQQWIVSKWHQFVLRTQYLRTIDKRVKVKAKIRSKRWAFLALKEHWIRMKLVQGCQTQRLHRTRLTFFRVWRANVQCWKDATYRVAQMQTRIAHRLLRRLVSFWMVYAALKRTSAFAEAATKLGARVKLLETDLEGAERVQHQMEKLVLELKNERAKIMASAEAAVARTPVWTSGFLDVELRWRTPPLAWLPPARAGHTAVSLPGNHGTHFRSRVIFFGGYNGEECFNHVLIFDTEEMHWKAPALSASEGSVIPRAMQTHTACPFGKNKMVVFGGYDGSKEFSEVSVLKISDDSLACEWSQLQCIVGAKPGPLCQHTSCLYEDGPCMLVFGGYRSNVGLLNELWVLDFHWLHWTCPEYSGTPPTPRRGHGAAVIGNKMYTFGGYNGREHLGDLHALDITLMLWECIEGECLGPGPSPRRQHSMTVVGHHLVIYGGYNGQRYLGDVFSFDTLHKRWKQWPEKEAQLPLEEVGQGGQVYGRSMHTAVDAGQQLIIFGGVHEWGALQDMLVLENAAASDGLQVQRSLFEELDKASKLQAKITEYEKLLTQNTTKLAEADTAVGQLRTTLQVESEKRKKAVQGNRVLTKKLHKARSISECLSQTCERYLLDNLQPDI